MREVSAPVKAVVLLDIEAQPQGQRAVGARNDARSRGYEHCRIQLPVQSGGDPCLGCAVMRVLVGTVILEGSKE